MEMRNKCNEIIFIYKASIYWAWNLNGGSGYRITTSCLMRALRTFLVYMQELF